MNINEHNSAIERSVSPFNAAIFEIQNLELNSPENGNILVKNVDGTLCISCPKHELTVRINCDGNNTVYFYDSISGDRSSHNYFDLKDLNTSSGSLRHWRRWNLLNPKFYYDKANELISLVEASLSNHSGLEDFDDITINEILSDSNSLAELFQLKSVEHSEYGEIRFRYFENTGQLSLSISSLGVIIYLQEGSDSNQLIWFDESFSGHPKDHIRPRNYIHLDTMKEYYTSSYISHWNGGWKIQDPKYYVDLITAMPGFLKDLLGN